MNDCLKLPAISLKYVVGNFVLKEKKDICRSLCERRLG